MGHSQYSKSIRGGLASKEDRERAIFEQKKNTEFKRKLSASLKKSYSMSNTRTEKWLIDVETWKSLVGSTKEVSMKWGM